jgi:hypothetical protein
MTMGIVPLAIQAPIRIPTQIVDAVDDSPFHICPFETQDQAHTSSDECRRN